MGIPMKQYDYLIIGAGLYGAIFANEATKKGRKCLVIEKRNHIAGNIYSKNVEGIDVHQYGAHIFHTSDKHVWDYVNRFSEFNNYINSPVAISHGKLYNLPFNMNTFNQLWGVKTPQEAHKKILEQTQKYSHIEPNNLEESALSLIGDDVYNTLIKEYTEKQWGRDPKELPSFIIKRLPVRFTFDNNYFNDRYQGIPSSGYTKMVENILNGIEVRLNTDFFTDRDFYENCAEKIVYTGMIDEYYDYCFGVLEYRSLKFEIEILDTDNYQGNAVVNHIDREIPYTRIIEHKHFQFGTQEKTIITREYPALYEKGQDAYYPINDEKNSTLYQKYKDHAQKSQNTIFGGRLAEYKYYDMHQVIAKVLEDCKKYLGD